MSDDRHRPPGRARPSRDDEETREIKTPGGDSLTAAQAEADTGSGLADELAKGLASHRREVREERLDKIRDRICEAQSDKPHYESLFGEDLEAEVWSQYADEIEEELGRSQTLVKRYQGITLAAWGRTGDILPDYDPAQGWADRLESLLRVLIDRYQGNEE